MASRGERRLMVSFPSENSTRTGRAPDRRWRKLKSAAKISASKSGVVLQVLTVSSGPRGSAAWQPLEHTIAVLTPPKDSTDMVSEVVDCARPTRSSTALLVTPDRDATDPLAST